MTTPQPRGILRTLTLCLHFPIVTTALWGQLTGKTMTVLPCSLVLYCTAMFYLGLSNPYKTQHIYQAMDTPVLLRGWGEAVVTNDWCIIYSLWCTCHEHLVLSHPQKYIDPKHKIWHPLIYCPTYLQARSQPITCFSFRPQHYFYWMSLFQLNHTYRVSPVIIFSYQL